MNKIWHLFSAESRIIFFCHAKKPFTLIEEHCPAKQSSSFIKWKKVKSLSHVRLFATPLTVAYQAPPSMGFSRQEYWSGLPFPSPGDLPRVIFAWVLLRPLAVMTQPFRTWQNTLSQTSLSISSLVPACMQNVSFLLFSLSSFKRLKTMGKPVCTFFPNHLLLKTSNSTLLPA